MKKLSNSIPKSGKSSGFTLVELLIVMSIISVLVTIAVVSFRGANIRALDTKRKGDLKQYQTALEVYASKNNGFYPRYGTVTQAAGPLCTTALGLTSCPDDPRPASANIHYNYRSSGSGAAGSPTATFYVLWAQLEQSPSNYWIVCSNGRAGEAPSTTIISGVSCPV